MLYIFILYELPEITLIDVAHKSCDVIVAIITILLIVIIILMREHKISC